MDGAFPSSLGEGGGEEERRRGFRGTQENAKTKLCLRWKSGHCRFGDSCNFAHGEEEIRQLPPRGYVGGGGGGGGGRGRGGFGGYEGTSYGGYGGEQMDQAFYGRGRGGAGSGGIGSGGGRGPSSGSHTHSMPAGYNDARAQDGQLNSNNDIWAQQGYPVQGPNNWTQYTTLDTGEAYYHNSLTNETVWDKPREWQ